MPRPDANFPPPPRIIDKTDAWDRKQQEKDPSGKSPHEPGAKLDAGKPSPFQGLTRYFPRAMMEVARVSTYGAIKYTWNGWRSVPDGQTRYADAGERHRLRMQIEGPFDMETAVHPKTGDPMPPLRHRAQSAWNELAVLELELEDEENRAKGLNGQGGAA